MLTQLTSVAFCEKELCVDVTPVVPSGSQTCVLGEKEARRAQVAGAAGRQRAGTVYQHLQRPAGRHPHPARRVSNTGHAPVHCRSLFRQFPHYTLILLGV